MSFYVVVVYAILISISSSAWADQRCQVPVEGEPVVYMSDFENYQPFSEMKALYEEYYEGDKRLWKRAFRDNSGQVLMPLNRGGQNLVRVPQRFIASVTRHIETALQHGYVDFIFFPDMGHSHFYVPEQVWEESLKGFPVNETHLFYEKLFATDELLSLYHTAEKLENPKPGDRHTMWRFMTRNPVGDNKGGGIRFIAKDLESKGNTVSDLPGYHCYGAGVSISAHRLGCFPFVHQGTTYYFDISFEDPPWNPNVGGGYFRHHPDR